MKRFPEATDYYERSLKLMKDLGTIKHGGHMLEQLINCLKEIKQEGRI